MKGAVASETNLFTASQVPSETQSNSSKVTSSQLDTHNDKDSGCGGEALEWAQVIELQAFSERKAWIEEKTRLLEQLPPIEVFTALDSLRNGSEEISSSLPTRAELQQWITEHDRIEKETEIFDAGEFRKLKKFTKAAAQRNLSPADTDLIELTLTTIYALDKLLHLLRDRSEQLDLLDVRLTWEEQRHAAWTDYRKILKDLNTFLPTRAQWSPVIYDSVIQDRPSANDTPIRRNSVTSIASVASDSSSASPANLSRSARFKLAEVLSKEAAQISTRISTLRHSRISPAGKTLDKLIDDSRTPVPDVILDEQDRLENKGITEMEDVSQFVMSVVMQWKKADEIYIENKKDQAAAQTLIEEIEIAKMSHPQARPDIIFISRANALTKRLSQRANPASVSNTILRPVHPSFPGQATSNTVIIDILSSEMAFSLDLAQRVEVLAKEYHASYEVVNRIETLCASAQEYMSSFNSLIHRLENGVEAPDGDGTPPSLDDIACLEPASHSAFLALFPSLLAAMDDLNGQVNATMRGFSTALLCLDRPGIDSDFKTHAVSVAEQLSSHQNAAQRIRDDVAHRVIQLRQIRKVRSLFDNAVGILEDFRQDIDDGIRRDKWTLQSVRVSAPLTPESSMESLPATETIPAAVLLGLDDLQSTELHEISSSFASIASSLPSNLRNWMTQDLSELSIIMDNLRNATHLWRTIRDQSSAMALVMDEGNDFRPKLEDLKTGYEEYIEHVLNAKFSEEEINSTEERLVAETKELRENIRGFIDNIPRRILFVSSNTTISRPFPSHIRRRSLFSGKIVSMSDLRQQYQADSPVDPAALDNSIRVDCNQLCLTLSGAVQSLQARTDHFKLARISHAANISLRALNDSLTRIAGEISAQESSFYAQESADLDQLEILSEQSNHHFGTNRAEINRSLSCVRGLIAQMEDTPSNRDTAVYERMVLPRSRALKESETRFNVLEDRISRFKDAIMERQNVRRAELAEAARIEEEKQQRMRQEAEEQKRQEQEERQRIEKQKGLEQEERQRIEKQKGLEQEERQRIEEQERLDQEERRRVEEEKKALEETEKKLRAEELMHRREEILQKEKKEAEENERIVTEEKERLKAEEKKQREVEAAEEKTRKAEKNERAERERIVESERRAQENKVEREAEEMKKKKEEQRLQDVSLRDRDTRHSESKERRWTAEIGREFTPFASRDNKNGEDVFGRFFLAPAAEISTKSNELIGLQFKIVQLRKRLRSLGINDIVRPASSARPLPSSDVRDRIVSDLASIAKQVSELPPSVADKSVDMELKSLREELSAYSQLLENLHKLADFSNVVGLCDGSLSDLLEHIDSFPSLPMSPLASVHVPDRTIQPEEQLSARLTFTRLSVDEVRKLAVSFSDDVRIINEESRIVQTWNELEAMGKDLLLSGKKSRPPSAASSGKTSGRNSRASMDTSNRAHRKAGSYAKLTAGRMSTDGLLLPPKPHARRAASNTTTVNANERSSSRLSVSSRASSTRSVSGPGLVSNPSSTLFNSTVSSRQRTASLTSNASPNVSRTSAASPMLSRSRARTGSHAGSGSSLLSRSAMGAPSGPVWPRPLRQSLSSRPSTPRPQKVKQSKQPYVPNPGNKLDVAVGDVVNKLPININVEVVAETWKDQSGKYWIGDQEPKLCFCRILRSQTVMVRVGGGWQELSKFINNHFADLYRLFPPDSPNRGSREEKWISAATLRAAEVSNGAPSLPPPPRTPEPSIDSLPSFAFSTPSGRSPRSVKSSSSPGSPLTPLQFMRRADIDSFQRPETPLKSPSLRPRTILPVTPRQHAWRP